MVCESMAEDRSEGSVSNTVKSDQFMSADDYAPKVRKPYTITKQRERWTEEEHKKFLEALKLYGRAWRRIEEHVATKTAVQIRSHAQKFFSKVVRESTSGDASEVKPIEIPPPRPKRKPMHPYPRKLSAPLKTGGHVRSTSPNSSGSDQENQSPTSVLSAGGSNMFALGDSGSPNAGLSPVSSANGMKAGLFEPDLSPEENESVQEDDCPSPTKLETCCEEKTQSLKLFGKTVVVSEPYSQKNGVVNFVPPVGCGPPVYYMQFLDEKCESSVGGWSVYGYPVVPPCNPTEVQKEGSSGVKEEEEREKKPFLLIASERSAFRKQQYRENGDGKKKEKCIKGFVPYKRCLEQREAHSSGEERDEQRIRLCL